MDRSAGIASAVNSGPRAGPWPRKILHATPAGHRFPRPRCGPLVANPAQAAARFAPRSRRSSGAMRADVLANRLLLSVFASRRRPARQRARPNARGRRRISGLSAAAGLLLLDIAIRLRDDKGVSRPPHLAGATYCARKLVCSDPPPIARLLKAAVDCARRHASP